MDNLDMKKLMNLLSTVDKENLQKSMEIADKIMRADNREEIINKLKKNLE